ncbi:MAG: nucleotidyltransferase family protein [Dehalococcoidia bacterium]|nr:nucleotidyltransferase family protein [Dehalococcoidia bacterium]
MAASSTVTARALRAAIAPPVPALGPRAQALLRDCEPAELARLAVEHGVAPWLSSAIAACPELRGDGRFAPVMDAGTAQTFHTLRLYAELASLLGTLNCGEIPVVVLKGPVLADTCYPDASLRPYRDVDILIREEHIGRVSAILADRGYVLDNDDVSDHRLHVCHGIFQHIFRHTTFGYVVEVHCDHLQIGLEPVSMDTIWASAREQRFGRATARVLEVHDMFVQLCVHLHRHGFARLIWFKDLDLVIRSGDLDWALVETKAREQGSLDSVGYTLSLLPRVLGTRLPAEARRLAGAQSRVSRAFYRIVWPPSRIAALEPQRQWRLRRLVQFAPETSLLRGGLPSLLLNGRRKDKLRVLASAATQGRGAARG